MFAHHSAIKAHIDANAVIGRSIHQDHAIADGRVAKVVGLGNSDQESSFRRIPSACRCAPELESSPRNFGPYLGNSAFASE